MLGNFSDGNVTDGSWKCSSVKPSDQWISSTFDDSSWPNALATEGQGGKWPNQPNIANNAKWIWAGNSYVYNGSTSNIAYCRRKIDILEESVNIEPPTTTTKGTSPFFTLLHKPLYCLLQFH